MSLVLRWWSIIDAWKKAREDIVKTTFKNIAYMTRYGRIGYEEAMRIPAWERAHFLESINELIHEERPGSLNPEDD